MKTTDILTSYAEELNRLEQESNLRKLSSITHQENRVKLKGTSMLNLSSNDYLGLATDRELKVEFINHCSTEELFFSSSSSRLLTGNFPVNEEVETILTTLFQAESALIFNSGYHMNMGILPAICDSHTLILADKLVHASIVDGIRLSAAKCIRYRHNDYQQLERLVTTHQDGFNKIIIVTESIFSMDGDIADLRYLVELKKQYSNILIYVDEAHAIGIRGKNGLGCAEEQDVLYDIDFLTGTFGKALASVGGYLVCKKVIREYLINKMRTLIFTTALPPINLLWTKFILERWNSFHEKREKLNLISGILHRELKYKGLSSPSETHIIPIITGESRKALLKAEEMQRKGFYVLPVRPPTVPEGTSRLRISLTASISEKEIRQFINYL